MENTKRKRRHADWLGLDTVLTVKVSDADLIGLAKAKKATGRTRSSLVRAGIAQVVRQAEQAAEEVANR